MTRFGRILAAIIGGPDTPLARRVFQGILAVFLLPLLALFVLGIVGTVLAGYRRERTIVQQRALHKVRIGDTQATVKSRLGEPARLVRNDSELVTSWEYPNPDSATTNWVMLADGPGGPAVTLVELVRSNPPLWRPEEGEDPSPGSDPWQAMRNFTALHGPACDTLFGADRTHVALMFPLSVIELREDQRYDAMVRRPAPQHRVARFLSVALNLRTGVTGAGWKAISPASPCYAIAARNRP